MKITLDDKYIKNQGKVFVTGSQVLVKLPLVQKILDEKLNLNTSGFISGAEDLLQVFMIKRYGKLKLLKKIL